MIPSGRTILIIAAALLAGPVAYAEEKPAPKGLVATDQTFDLNSATACGKGFCSAAIPYQCAKVNEPAAEALCRSKKFLRARSYEVMDGPKDSQCGDAEGKGCFLNRNPRCNTVFSKITCTNAPMEAPVK